MAEQPTLARKETREDLAFKREVARIVDGISQSGRVDWVREFELPADGSTSMVVPDRSVTRDCQISLQPVSAAAAIIVTGVYIDPGEYIAETDEVPGSFTVRYPSLVSSARFRYCIKG